jgi:hypothetical protein
MSRSVSRGQTGAALRELRLGTFAATAPLSHFKSHLGSGTDMTTTAKFIESKETLSWLKPVFKELKRIIDEYVEWHDQPPYWNNENASVSILVAAGACAGYSVLSDYRTEKKQKRKHVNGRCDLFLGKENQWLEIEAKPMYVSPDDEPEKITKVLERAVDAARCLVPRQPKHHAGLVFAVMSIPADNQNVNWGTDFRKSFKQVEADLCWMWHDSNADKKYQWEKEKRRHPGLGIFLKTV